MSGTTSNTAFGADDSAIPAAIGGGGTAGPSVGAGDATGQVVSVNISGVDLVGLPAQYSTASADGTGLGFFTRQLEYVPTAVTVGPDNALYVGGLSGLPYPDGYSRVMRVADAQATTGFDGQIDSGVPQTYVSGLSQVNGLSFDGKDNLYVLEFVNSANIYDPTRQPGDLPPSELIRIAPDGVRTTISGPELKLGNYVLADKHTGDVYVAIGNADINNGQVLRYQVDDATGQATSVDVVASGLNNPRGMAFGPDGQLYVNEQGLGTPGDSPDAATAPIIPFIPGVVDERGGFTASITRIDIDGAGQERIFTGLPSIREVDAITGEDRVISIGSNGFAIGPDGTAYVATGGGLSAATAEGLGPLAPFVQGLLKIEGLFDQDPSDAMVTPTFNSVTYAGENGPDGSQTLFNTQSNLNDVAVGPDGTVYAVDAARNVMYGFSPDDLFTPESVTVFQKQAPVLTPPQYAAVVAAGGNPSLDYQTEIAQTTFKAANGAPDTPGRAAAAASFSPADPAAAVAGAPSGPPGAGVAPVGIDTAVLPRGEDASVGTASAGGTSGLPGVIPVSDPSFPGPIDPLSTPILPGNIYSPYYDPFFGGNYAPATPPALQAGEHGGTYSVSHLYSFGDRLVDDGGSYGAAAVAEGIGQLAPNASPIYYQGGFSDGPNWTDNLSRILGAKQVPGEDDNFGYVLATARPIENPLDPFTGQTTLNTFDGQIDAFEHAYGAFSANDLVTVTFGGNDLTLPSNLSPEEGVTASVQSIVDGLDRLANLGAHHFVITNLPDLELAPLFRAPDFLEQLGAEPGSYQPLVAAFNTQLAEAVHAFEGERSVDVTLLDVHKLFDAIVADPTAYGFSNVDEPVLIAPPLQPGTSTVYNPVIVGQDPAVQHASLFIDPFFHPTALGHAILAETAWHVIA